MTVLRVVNLKSITWVALWVATSFFQSHASSGAAAVSLDGAEPKGAFAEAYSAEPLDHNFSSAKAELEKLHCRAVADQARTIFSKMNTTGKLVFQEGDETDQNYSTMWDLEMKIRIAKDDQGQPVRSLYYHYEKKKGILLTDALTDLLEKGGHIECMIASHIVKILCLGNIANEIAFELEERGESVVLDSLHNPKVLHTFLVTEPPVMPKVVTKPGVFGYISNIPHYPGIHPENDTSRGWNIVCVGKNQKGKSLYTGFDPEGKIFTEPRTFEEIHDFLYRDLIKPITTTGLNPMEKNIYYLCTMDRRCFNDMSSFIQQVSPSYALRFL